MRPSDAGAHIAEDFAVVEVLTLDRDEPVADGERGRLVVTSLGRDNPMIRYDLEDVVRVDCVALSVRRDLRRAGGKEG